MDKVAIYARVSTADTQDYDRQITDLTKIINYHGYIDDQIETYAEKLSGYKKNQDRPELNKLLQSATNYKCIYVTEISRLGRDPKHTREIIEDLTEKKIPVYIQNISQFSLDHDGNRSMVMNIILQVMMEFAHLEAVTMKTRMKSGKLDKVKKGKVSGANHAYGYQNVEGYLEIDPEESVVVQQIFEMYKQGNGIHTIAQTLTQMGIPTRYNKSHENKEVKLRRSSLTKSGSTIKWDGATIRQILKNPTYIGQRKFKIKDEVKDSKGKIESPKEFITVPSPAIVTEHIFNYCNDLMSNKSNRNFITSYEYLLKDILYCGCCGKKYYAHYSAKKKDTKVYQCASKIRAKGCGNTAVNISYIESVIFNEFINSKTVLSILDNPNDLKNQVETELSQLEQQLKNEIHQKETKLAEQAKLLDLYLSGSPISKDLLDQKQDTLNKEIEAIDSKLHSLNTEIFNKRRILANYDAEQASVDMLRQAKENRHELRLIYSQLIDKIIINGINKDYILITLYAKVRGVTLQNTLKLFLWNSGVKYSGRTRPKSYKYIPTLSITNEPEFENNILRTDKTELSKELDYIIEQASIQTLTKLPYEFVNVPRENWLYINESDL